MTTRRARLDTEMVRRQLAATRTEAQQLIADGRVTVEGRPALKAATLVAAGEDIVVAGPGRPYVSRGGCKLADALARLGVSVAGRVCLDAGASTGGFTDVLLRAGASRVVATDVGYGQLAWSLRGDDRVVVLERTNVRHLSPDDIPEPPPSLVTADLSFISLTRVLPALVAVSAGEADHLLLVKPQFEAGPRDVGKKGVVRDPRVWRRALLRVADSAAEVGLGVVTAVPARPLGPSGNAEFFWHLRTDGSGDPDALADAAVADAEARRAADPEQGGEPGRVRPDDRLDGEDGPGR